MAKALINNGRQWTINFVVEKVTICTHSQDLFWKAGRVKAGARRLCDGGTYFERDILALFNSLKLNINYLGTNSLKIIF